MAAMFRGAGVGAGAGPAAPVDAAAQAALAALGLPPGHASAPFLAAELAKPYFRALAAFVEAQRARGRVYPPRGQELAALGLFPAGLAGVRVVILGQDPYINEGQAHGLSFSVPSGVAQPPSLKNILKELADDVGGGAPRSGNLEPWARRGVLLLNTCLTVDAGASNSHAGRGWETFSDAVIRRVSAESPRCVFILWGKPAAEKKKLIDGSRHLVLEAPHPSPLSAFRGFFGSKPFSKANAFLVRHGLAPIDWRI